MLGSIALEIAENVVISVVSYNAYVDCDLINDDDGNPDEIVLKAGYNTVGLVKDGHVEYVLDGKEKDPLQTFRAGRRKPIPHTNPEDPALSEGYNTSTGADDNDPPRTAVLTATKDATCFAYVDGNLTSGATPVGLSIKLIGMQAKRSLRVLLKRAAPHRLMIGCVTTTPTTVCQRHNSLL